HRRQELVQVAQMVLAELAGRVSHRFEDVGDSDRLIRDAEWSSGLSDCRKAGAKWQFASDEVRPSGGATGFRIIIGEAHSLGGQAVEIGCPSRHDTLVIDLNIGPPDVVAHDDNDIRSLLLCLRRTDERRQGAQQQSGSDPTEQLTHRVSHFSISSRYGIQNLSVTSIGSEWIAV